MSLHEAQPPFVALGARPMRVLQRAYVAAVRRGASSVGTLDLLCQVALYHKSVPPWLLEGANGANLMRMALDPRRIPGGRAVGELLPGEVSGFDPEAQAVLREVEWRVHRQPDRQLRKSDAQGMALRPPWTHGVRTTLAGTLQVAHDNRVPFANLSHLVLSMLRLPACDGTRYTFPYESSRLAATDRLRSEPAMRWADEPYPDLDDERLVISPKSGSLLERLAGAMFARMSRLSRIGPILVGVDAEARRQAVRLDHDVIGPVHVLLAMLTHDAALEAARIRVPAHHSSRNRGAQVLRTHGIGADHLRMLAVRLGGPEEPPAEVLTERLRNQRPGDPFTGAEVATAQARAMEISLAYRHSDTGTSHLLFALIEDDAGDGTAILRDLGLDPKAVRAQGEQDLRAARAAW